MTAEPAEVLWTGNLATPRRTGLGVLGMLERSRISVEEAPAFLQSCGLPPIALEEPDIPIQREQQLVCLGRVLRRLDPALSVPHHALEVGLGVHITVFGVLGLALMYAGSLRECLRIITSYAELSWGHSRILAAREGELVFVSFVMDGRVPGASAAGQAALRDFCVTVDLSATIKMTSDIFGPSFRPSEVWLPYPAPPDHRAMSRRLGCPVRFDAPETRLYFRRELWGATPLLANPVVFRSYEKQAAELARRLRTDVPLAEQVRRLLWMSSPPPDRDTVAGMLAMSPRTLARKLADEGTGYGELQRDVRLARAHELLRNRTLHVAEVADRLGFSDAAAFTRAFRQWTGETPSAWRERHGGSERVGGGPSPADG